MAHGAPDFSKYRRDSASYSLEDLSELAVRLGSIVAFDRLGDIALLDGFESGLSMWTLTGTGTGYEQVIDTDHYRTRTPSAKLTTGEEDGSWVNIMRHAFYPGARRIGLEVSLTTHASQSLLRLRLLIRDGTHDHTIEILLKPTTDTIAYYDDNYDEATLDDTLSIHHDEHLFHVLKLVADLDTNEYVRIRFDNQTWDMTGIAYRTRATALAPVIFIDIEVTDNIAANMSVYIDNVILTKDEP